VEPSYPAEDAGIQIGDVLVSMNSVALKSKANLKSRMEKLAEGDLVKLEFSRDGKLKSVELNLVKR
jgi:serine protease Do